MEIMRYLGIERACPPEILRIARRARRWVRRQSGGCVSGWCEDASNRLVRMLNVELKISSHTDIREFCVDKRFQCWHGHVVVIVNRVILDVTGDQFNDLLAVHGERVRVRSVVYGSVRELDGYYQGRK
jgi:hypothetical protein